jgi:hypothetical protein
VSGVRGKKIASPADALDAVEIPSARADDVEKPELEGADRYSKASQRPRSGGVRERRVSGTSGPKRSIVDVRTVEIGSRAWDAQIAAAPNTKHMLDRSPKMAPVVQAMGGPKTYESLKRKSSYGTLTPDEGVLLALLEIPGALEGARRFAAEKGTAKLVDATLLMADFNRYSLSTGLRTILDEHLLGDLVRRVGFKRAAMALVAAEKVDDYDRRFRSIGDFIALNGFDSKAFQELVAHQSPRRVALALTEAAALHEEEFSRVEDRSKAPDHATRVAWSVRSFELRGALPPGDRPDAWIEALIGANGALALADWMGPRALVMFRATGVPEANALLEGPGGDAAQDVRARRLLYLAVARSVRLTTILKESFAALGAAELGRIAQVLAEHDRRFDLDPVFPSAPFLIARLGFARASAVAACIAQTPEAARRFFARAGDSWLTRVRALEGIAPEALARAFSEAPSLGWKPDLEYRTRHGSFEVRRFGTVDREGFPAHAEFGPSMLRAVGEGVARLELGEIRSALDLWNHLRFWRATIGDRLGQSGDPMYGGRIFMGPLPNWGSTGGTHIDGRYFFMAPRIRTLFPEPVPLAKLAQEDERYAAWGRPREAHKADTFVHRGTIFGEHNGELIPLTFLVLCEDAGPRSTIWHSSRESVERASEHVESLFARSLDPSVDESELLDLAPRLHWWLCQMCPDKSGSAAQADAFVRTVLAARGILLPPWKSGVVPDLEALFSHEPDFVRAWPSFLEGAI